MSKNNNKEPSKNICLNCNSYFSNCYGHRKGCKAFTKFDNEKFEKELKKNLQKFGRS